MVCCVVIFYIYFLTPNQQRQNSEGNWHNLRYDNSLVLLNFLLTV